MKIYLKNTWHLINNYAFTYLFNRVSTTSFWYLDEPSNLKNTHDFEKYKNTQQSPFYFIDYRNKLKYNLTNQDNIIVLPYPKPIDQQINPEAAFQYALGLHDDYHHSHNTKSLDYFIHYAEHFTKFQNSQGLWPYQFDWYGSKAPWYSALAQARGASVMLRAFQLTKNTKYLSAARLALKQFSVLTTKGGFLHHFRFNQTPYFEEYPNTPTGVLNGFMSTLMGLWELNFWASEKWLNDLWNIGIASLEKMLPFYSTGWWSIYDLDENTPVVNVNSPRYHLLEMNYLQILSILSGSPIISNEYHRRKQQYQNPYLRSKAFLLKSIRKICYR